MKIESDYSESTINEVELDHDSVNTDSSGDWVMSKPNEISLSTNVVVNSLPSSLRHEDASTTDENKDKLFPQIIDKEMFLQAIEAGNLVYVKEYMKSMDQHEVNMEVSNGKTTLHYACMYGNINIVQYVLQELCADIKTKSKDGKNALHVACDNGNLSIVQYLLDHDITIVNCTQTDGSTALHVACSRGHLDIVKHLLTMNGIDVIWTQNDGWTAVHVATQKGHCSIVQNVLNSTKGGTANHSKLISMPANDGKLALHFACRDGYLDIVQCLLQHDHSLVDKQDIYGWNALHYATRYNHLDIVQYLINVGHARMDQVTKDGMSALHLASVNGHFDVVKVMLPLIQKRAQITTPTFQRINVNCGGTVHTDVNGNVWEADDTNKYFSYGRVEDTSEYYTWKGTDRMLFQQHRCGQSFSYNVPRLPNGFYYINIHYIQSFSLNNNGFNVYINQNFATNRMLSTTLLDNKASSNIEMFVCHVKEKQLRVRISSTFIRASDACISRVAVIPIRLEPATTASKDEVKAYHVACMNGWLNIVQFFVQNDIIPLDLAWCDKQNALRVAIRHNQIEIVKYLLHYYDDVIDTTMTHLHYASMHGSLKSIEFLLGVNETNINETKKDAWTALHFASRNGHVDVVKSLIKVEDIDIEAKTSSGCTSLHLAARFGHINVVQYLICDVFAKVDAASNDGLTALHFATLHGYYNVVHYLLTDGNANPGAKTKQGLTALHIAASNNSLEITKLLLDYPSSNTKNVKGESPLEYSIRLTKLNEFCVYLNVTDTNDTISLLQYHASGSLSKRIDTFDNDAHNKLYDAF